MCREVEECEKNNGGGGIKYVKLLGLSKYLGGLEGLKEE